MEKLALSGGEPAITLPHPHEVWPPIASPAELTELAAQRNSDIAIRGASGPIRELEDLFLQFLDGRNRYAITFNSGTSALFAAYFALGVQKDVEVLGPALTYHAALSPVYVLKGSVVLVDVHADTRCIDPAEIERHITPATRVLTVVHQWGHPCDMDRIMEIAARHRIAVVEDCSHAHGSRYKGQPCGTFGDVGVFSLQANKAIFAGEGGILVTSRDDVHDRATLLGHYRDRARDAVTDPQLRRYWVTGYGLKLRMSPFNAIVAKHALAAFDSRMKERHTCLEYFRRKLTDVRYLQPVKVAQYAHMGAWYGFKPLYRPEMLGGMPKAELIEILRAEGMEISDPSGPCLANLPLFAEESSGLFSGHTVHPNDPTAYPVALDIEARALSLPTFTNWAADRLLMDQYLAAFHKVDRLLAY
jgi:dTDP-4-amino-4,6-dideoxygalactose transaminase